MAVMAIAAATFSSCGNSSAPKADLKTDVDSMSYAIGYVQSQYMRQAIEQGQVIDTTYMDEFVKGVNEGVNAGDDKKKAAYIIGLQVGQQISGQLLKGINNEVYGGDSTKTISLKNLLAGFITGVTGKKGIMTPEAANMVAQTKMQEIKTKTMAKQYGANKAAGERFLAANKKKPGVVTLPSGLLTHNPTTNAFPSLCRPSQSHAPTVACMFASERLLTAAGLSGICTRFPF